MIAFLLFAVVLAKDAYVLELESGGYVKARPGDCVYLGTDLTVKDLEKIKTHFQIQPNAKSFRVSHKNIDFQGKTYPDYTDSYKDVDCVESEGARVVNETITKLHIRFD